MSLITSLFCPICEQLYDDKTKRPRWGKCLHTVCERCQTDSNCQICDKEGAFSEVIYNYNLIPLFEKLRLESTEDLLEQLSLEPKKLHIGLCIFCKSHDSLRMCVTCAESSELMKKLENGKFKLLERNKIIYLSKSIFVCSNCILNDRLGDHRGHLILPLSRINVMEVDLEVWYHAIHAILLERTWKDTKAMNILEQITLRLKRESMMYDVLCQQKEKEFLFFERQFKLEEIKYVDVQSVPELKKAKEKSFERAKRIMERIAKVQERQLWITKEELSHYVEKFKTDDLKVEDQCWKDFKAEINTFSSKFNTYKLIDLTPQEAEEIEKETDKKLGELMKKLEYFEKTEDEKTIKFFSYKALCNLMRESQTRRRQNIEDLDEVRSEFEDFFRNRMINGMEEIIMSNEEKDKIAHRLFLFELTERSFKVDRLMLEGLEAIYEHFQGQLIWTMYFKEESLLFTDNSIYSELLAKEFLNENDRAIYDILHLL